MSSANLSLMQKAVDVAASNWALKSQGPGAGPYPAFSTLEFMKKMNDKPNEYRGTANNIFKLKLDKWAIDTNPLQDRSIGCKFLFFWGQPHVIVVWGLPATSIHC